jgi:hypothetical protein
MPVDYAKLSQVAVSLIGDNGRSITLSRRDPAAAPDPAKPWEPAAPATAPGAHNVTVTGVNVEISKRQQDDDIVESNDKRWLIAASGAPADLGVEWLLTDNSEVYQIVVAELIKPGDTPIYWDVIGRT